MQEFFEVCAGLAGFVFALHAIFCPVHWLAFGSVVYLIYRRYWKGEPAVKITINSHCDGCKGHD